MTKVIGLKFGEVLYLPVNRLAWLSKYNTTISFCFVYHFQQERIFFSKCTDWSTSWLL